MKKSLVENLFSLTSHIIMTPCFGNWTSKQSDNLISKCHTGSAMYPLKCLSIGTPNTTTFPFVPNGKWWLLGVSIFEHIIIMMLFALILGHLKIINFPFGTNGKFIIFKCPNT